jgi:hypothetical protein
LPLVKFFTSVGASTPRLSRQPPPLVPPGPVVHDPAVDESLVERWRDLGPALWLIAGAAAAAWAALLGAVAFATRSRAVEPGPATLDFGGPETPAVVNLLTND